MPDGAEKVKMTEILKMLEKENQIIKQLSNGIKSFNNELNPQDIKKLTKKPLFYNTNYILVYLFDKEH